MRARRWTEQRVKTLRRLAAQGASARTIAGRIGGVSRAAVLGKISRLRRAANAVEAAARKCSPARPRGPGKTLLELTNHSCRWPIGEPGRRGFHFCGADGADLERAMPYCARHARRAYGNDAAAAEPKNPRRAPARRRVAPRS